MKPLYITSMSDQSGKTMLAAGLGKYWLDNGKKVGYLKLKIHGQSVMDRELVFLQKLLELKGSIDSLISVSDDTGSSILASSTFQAGDNDVVIVEGLPLNSSAAIVDKVAAKVLVVHDYATDLSEAIPLYENLRDCLVGIVLNKVPRNKASRLNDMFKTKLSAKGLDYLGSVPEDRILMTLSVGDLAEILNGKILNSVDKSQDLIENFMMGSSTFDRGPVYYTRKENKATILWGERPGFRKAAMSNLQLATLQTSTRCLVLSSGVEPVPAVLQKADEKKVPVISTPASIPDLIRTLENSISNLKFTQVQKMPKLLEILRLNLDLSRLSERLN